MEWYRASMAAMNHKHNDWRFDPTPTRSTEHIEECFFKAKSPSNALQKDWKTPTDFVQCPTNPGDNPLVEYIDNLKEGNFFSANQYRRDIVMEAALIEDGKTIIVSSRAEDEKEQIKPFAIAKIYYSGGTFIHESVQTFFEEIGVTSCFKALKEGTEWDTDCLDLYCS